MNFSVVIPLYNKSYSIERCIDSVLKQSFSGFEIIVVNDGSTDESLSVVEKEYGKEIAEGIVRVIDQANQGVSVARNVGVKASASDFVCFLDADDVWLPFFLEKMASLVQDFPTGDLFCLAHLISKDGGKPVKAKSALPHDFRGEVDDFFVASAKGSVANSSKVCVRKSAILKMGGFPVLGLAGEDFYVWMMLALRGSVVCEASYQVIVFQTVDGSRSARKNSVPYPLVYFSRHKVPDGVKGIYRYLFVIFYKHFFDSLLSCRFGEAFVRLNMFVRVIFGAKHVRPE